MNIKVLIVTSLIIISLLFALPLFKQEEGQEGPKYCQADEDCVPATCCHPDDCVNRANKPECKGIMCTMECRPGTMDCGQGYCACVDNECRAIIG